MSGLVTLLRMKWNPPPEPVGSFEGQTIVFTGANTGIGFEAALKFVKLGAKHVILGVRDTEKGEQAKLEIERRTGKTDCVYVEQLDLLDYDSIKAFVKSMDHFERLDVLVLNAGVMMGKYETSKYGYEKTIQVNLLSSVLLALALLPKLRASATKDRKPVLLYVTSGLYKRSTIPANTPNIIQTYNKPEPFNHMKQYSTSKLLAMLAFRQLAGAREPDGKEVNAKPFTITTVCPGTCRSQLGRNHLYFLRLFMNVFMFLFFRPTENGGRAIVGAVLDGQHGGCWKDCINEELPDSLVGEDAFQDQEQLWGEIVQVLMNDIPETVEYVSEHIQASIAEGVSCIKPLIQSSS